MGQAAAQPRAQPASQSVSQPTVQPAEQPAAEPTEQPTTELGEQPLAAVDKADEEEREQPLVVAAPLGGPRALVAYLAGDCPACLRLGPVWREARGAAVRWLPKECYRADWSRGRDWPACELAGVAGYPTLRLEGGPGGQSMLYEGEITAEGLVRFLRAGMGPVEVERLGQRASAEAPLPAVQGSAASAADGAAAVLA